MTAREGVSGRAVVGVESESPDTTATTEWKQALSDIAREVRYRALEMIHWAGAGHPGGSLSVIDILVHLYFRVMNVRPETPQWDARDRLILGKGHATAALYAVLSRRGYMHDHVLHQYGEVRGPLQCHPDMHKTPGVDFSTGSLGQALSVAAGMTLAGCLRAARFHVYAVLGDGEMQEGQVWEAMRFTAERSLSRLICIVDYNGYQQSRATPEALPLERLAKQVEAFGWEVAVINGHNFEELEEGIAWARRTKDQPRCIIARTVKGKGVSFMEGDLSWHVRHPTHAELMVARQELLGQRH